MSNLSLAEKLAELPGPKRIKAIKKYSEDELIQLQHDWRGFWARPDQIAPPWNWSTWLIMAGRGFGKTRSGAEWTCERADLGGRRIALVGATAADVRDVIVEGESGILAIAKPGKRPIYEPSKRRLTWPNGSMATTYSADEPERLRGPQHTDAWGDELGAWRYPDALDQLELGLRLGDDPRMVITTTPKPIKMLKELIIREGKDVAVTRGSSYANLANLSPKFIDKIIRRYEGTRLGRQEINAELLDDVPGALWARTRIEGLRISKEQLPSLSRIVVAIDPAVTSGEDADETGIIVAGLDRNGHGYVLDDLSGQYQPLEWAAKAIEAYKKYSADRIVAEVNNGGEMVEATIRMVDPNAPYKAVRASRGKVIRAEPVSALYEQGRIHHVGTYADLEDQMCSFTTDFDRTEAGYSPDRLDAMVWGFHELIVGDMAEGWVRHYGDLAAAASAPPAPGQEPKERVMPNVPAEPPPEDNDLTTIYKDALLETQHQAVCPVCTKPVIGGQSYVTDGVSKWHEPCFPRGYHNPNP